MKTLLLLRHAKSSWDSPAARDFDRPLSGRGERDAPRIGKALKQSGVEVDLVVASPAQRARQTADEVLGAAKYKGPVKFDENIYEAAVSDLVAVVRGLPDDDETVLLIGHNPGFEELLGALCGSTSGPASARMPTAALALIELDVDRWRDADAGLGTLCWMVVPRLLG